MLYYLDSSQIFPTGLTLCPFFLSLCYKEPILYIEVPFGEAVKKIYPSIMTQTHENATRKPIAWYTNLKIFKLKAFSVGRLLG